MRRLQLWLGVTGAIALIASIAVFVQEESTSPEGTTQKSSPPQAPVAKIYAGSHSCAECHPVHVDLWKDSHHGLAERRLRQDEPAFAGAFELHHGTKHSEMYRDEKGPVIVTMGANGKRHPYRPVRVIGVAPLYQFLVPAAGGRYQVTELAFDPQREEWFDVYGDEDRRPHEWGFWTNRGMNWNSMCASCHTTALRKGYDPASDTYDTEWKELGVGCESCHGPYGAHAEWYRTHSAGEVWPGRRMSVRERMFDACGSCHARRVELTSHYVPGEPFFDHYRPVLPDEGEIYYPDGQVLEEDFEYGSFLLSRMHGEGVRCTTCHEPHTAKLRVKGNDLCLTCHKGKIDPAAHSHHDVSKPGGQCVNCHMPITVYMQRHPRRDHGFTIPDPLLTKELDIPNACNRCHSDQTIDWALQAVEKWYGDRMDRHTRTRTRAVAAARRGASDAADRLLAALQAEKLPPWRAVMVSLLRSWIHRQDVAARVREGLADPHPLVRAAAVQAMELYPQSARLAAPLVNDPVRLVRNAAAWVTRRTLDLKSRVGRELLAQLDQHADQPAGCYQLGVFYIDRRRLAEAERWLRRAIEWDPGTAQFRRVLAHALSLQGRGEEALSELQEACRLEKTNAEFHYLRGLAHAELGQINRTVEALERACRLDPQYGRAWYNLGLARDQLGDADGAVQALREAEAVEPRNFEYPWARATIHLRHGNRQVAREALEKVLKLNPQHTEARRVLAGL